VTEHLYRKFPERPEGELTAFRSALVNTNTLASIAGSLGMGNYLLLSRGEEQDTGRARQYILANTFEALVGAIYLDQGYEPAASFISHTILPLTDEMVKNRLWQDHKSLFQEKAQEIESVTPSYRTLEEVGPDHDKHFTVGVYLKDTCVATGKGKSKQEAEQDAARLGLLARKWE
jgi:ribonuclease-3